MGKKQRKIAAIVLAAVAVCSLAVVLLRAGDYSKGEKDYSDAADMIALPDLSDLPPPVAEPKPQEQESSDTVVEAPPAEPEEEKEVYVDPYADALRNMDFAALQEVNDEVLGWILIPDTRVSYPLVQGEDNSYYLNRTWKKWRSVVGSIFLECRNSPDFSDFNTVIYGHRMNNGSMFASLSKYKNQSYWEKHPCVYITDAAGTKKYDIFAAYEIGVTEETYRILFRDEGEKQTFLDFCMEQSLIETGIVPTVDDTIVTLSTCTGRGHATRWVVQARLQQESAADDAGEIPGEEAGGDVTEGDGADTGLPESGDAASGEAESQLPPGDTEETAGAEDDAAEEESGENA